ncbi:fragile histidine triad, partial [Tilletiopsis washingtonensis]
SGALRFADFDVTRQAFLRRPAVAAIVNLKPIVPGHVLVIPATPCARLADLPASVRPAFWQTVHEVADVVKQRYGGTSLTLSVQDGPEAGQSVPHLHVHVLPRRSGDFTPNDEIYEHLERF